MQYTPDQIITEIKLIYKLKNEIPFISDLTISRSAIVNHFGTWGDALFKAGLIPYPMDSYTLNEYKKYLKREWYFEVLLELYWEHVANVGHMKSPFINERMYNDYRKVKPQLPSPASLKTVFNAKHFYYVWENVHTRAYYPNYMKEFIEPK